MKKNIMLVITVLALAVQAMASNDFARYQVILNRKPFGDAPVIIAPPRVSKPRPVRNRPPPPPFTKTLKLVAIVDDGFGVRVGFVDLKKKKNIFLYVGESEDGVKVLKANYDKKETLLEKDGVESWLRMSALSSGSGSGMTLTASRSRPAPPVPTKRLSYRDRLRQRTLARARKVVKPPPMTGEALTKEYQRIQMDLIRKGQPPLPIPLTVEMDDQLVEEGFLEPTE